MKTILALLLLATPWSSAVAAPPSEPSPAEQVRSADVIALVSVTSVTQTAFTNAAGRLAATFIARANVERVLKGTALKALIVADGTEGTVLAADNLSGAVLKPGGWNLGTSRLLVFLKRSGDLYVASCLPGLWPVWGSGIPSESAVTWPRCTTLDGAEAAIHKALKK